MSAVRNKFFAVTIARRFSFVWFVWNALIASSTAIRRLIRLVGVAAGSVGGAATAVTTGVVAVTAAGTGMAATAAAAGDAGAGAAAGAEALAEGSKNLPCASMSLRPLARQSLRYWVMFTFVS
jgi:hypothetical protein